MKSMREAIARDPELMHGTPVFHGTRSRCQRLSTISRTIAKWLGVSGACYNGSGDPYQQNLRLRPISILVLWAPTIEAGQVMRVDRRQIDKPSEHFSCGLESGPKQSRALRYAVPDREPAPSRYVDLRVG